MVQPTLITQCRSVAKSVGCFQRRLFVCLFINTITSERVNVGWWNSGVRCIVQKSQPSSNLRVIALWVHAPKNCGVRLRRLENHWRLSSFLFTFYCSSIDFCRMSYMVLSVIIEDSHVIQVAPFSTQHYGIHWIRSLISVFPTVVGIPLPRVTTELRRVVVSIIRRWVSRICVWDLLVQIAMPRCMQSNPLSAYAIMSQ